MYLSVYLPWSTYPLRSKLASIVVLCAVQRCGSTGTQISDKCRPNRVLKIEKVHEKMATIIFSRGTVAWVGSWRPLRTGLIQLKLGEHSIKLSRPHLGSSCVTRLEFYIAVAWIGIIDGPWWCHWMEAANTCMVDWHKAGKATRWWTILYSMITLLWACLS